MTWVSYWSHRTWRTLKNSWAITFLGSPKFKISGSVSYLFMYFQGLSQGQHLLDVRWVDASLDGGKAGWMDAWMEGGGERGKEGREAWSRVTECYVCCCFTGSLFVENFSSRDEPLTVGTLSQGRGAVLA